jgi:hypothetical protein
MNLQHQGPHQLVLVRPGFTLLGPAPKWDANAPTEGCHHDPLPSVFPNDHGGKPVEDENIFIKMEPRP